MRAQRRGQLGQLGRLDQLGDLERQLAAVGDERLEQIVDVGVARGLVARHADAVVVAAQVDAALERAREHLGLRVRVEIDAQRVEVRARARRVAEPGAGPPRPPR